MHGRVTGHSLVARVGLVFALALSAARSADAYHTDDKRIIENTAYTLPQGEFSVGIMRAEGGAFDQLTIGTYTAGWILTAAIQQWVASVYAKAGLRVGDWAVSGQVDFWYIRISDLTVPGLVDHGNMNTDILPISVAGSYAPNNWFTSSFTANFVNTFAGGGQDVSATQFGTVAAVDNFNLTGFLEFEVRRVTELTLTGRYLPWVGTVAVEGQGNSGPTSAIKLRANVDAEALQGAWQIVPGVAFSWGLFNFRVGAGYGNFFFPGAGLATTDQGFVGEFDLYFRF